MKKFRKIMAILVAAVMIVAMAVPAWAASDAEGRFEEDGGSITITNIKAGETYTVWRMFELASFTDTDNHAGIHIAGDNDEAYSYVISEADPWYGWLKSEGYAVQLTSSTNDSSPTDKQLFWIQGSKISFNGRNDYHVIYATTNFKNSADLPTTNDPALDADTDYFNGDAATIQKFAQAAVAGAASLDFSAAPASNWAPIYNQAAANSNDLTFYGTGGSSADPRLPLGYYLVGSSQGTLCSLDTNNLAVTIHDKNQAATLIPATGKNVLNKDVEYVSATPWSITEANWVKNRDAKIGDTIYFRTTITAKQGAKNYVLHDVMEPGLDFDGVTTGKKIETIALTSDGSTYKVIPATADYDDDGDAQTAAVSKTNWTLYASGDGLTAATDGCDFEIKFADERLYDSNGNELIIQDDDVIYVYYSAKVSKTAVMYGSEVADTTAANKTTIKTASDTKIDELTTGSVAQVYPTSNDDNRNTNYTILTYGGNSVTEGFSKATVTVYQFDIVKTRQPADTSSTVFNLVKDATFKLFKATTTAPTAEGADTTPYVIGSTYYKDGAALSFIHADATNLYKYNGYNETTNKTDTITSLPSSEVNINGLDAGTYLLFEESAPTGYNKLANPILITVNGGTTTGEAGAKEGKITYRLKDNNDKVLDAVDKVWDAVVNTTTTPVSYNSAQEFGSGENTYFNGGLNIINVAGQELPSTGGMGTTVLYIVGGMLVILAGAYLFFSRKRTA